MDNALITFAIVVPVFFVAGLVKGATGMGLPTVAMGLLTLALTPLAAAALMLVPSTVTNIWQLVTGPSLFCLVRRFWAMMVAISGATLVCASLLAAGDAAFTTAALGLVLVVYAAYALYARPIHVPPRVERCLSPVVGLATGAVTGATGVFVIPAVPYLQALGLEKDDLVQALGLSFTVSTLALGAGLAARDALPTSDLGWSFVAVVPAMAGMQAGTWLRARISPERFRRWFLLCLLLLGTQMALRPWF
ncbi:hypothetical protein DFR49_0922 [Hephaestia caeni]|uniref:Probable membrane transporter protein n=1 Tax=Hephaestia caeni TaxID=645617 RepID=A0A397PL23_9SPHN|nr:sulfite exporter TauE/SafE family protein [Hephaestia caeni]RIA46381.1 hypothetical protein DFR49_0922 [Hephaestia caeni]